MKNLILIICLLVLSSCIKSGEFADDRNRMHEMNRDADVCEKNPSRCISGVTW